MLLAFASEWVLEAKAGFPRFEALRRSERRHPIEEVGERLRGMMPWLGSGASGPGAAGEAARHA